MKSTIFIIVTIGTYWDKQSRHIAWHKVEGYYTDRKKAEQRYANIVATGACGGSVEIVELDRQL